MELLFNSLLTSSDNTRSRPDAEEKEKTGAIAKLYRSEKTICKDLYKQSLQICANSLYKSIQTYLKSVDLD